MDRRLAPGPGCDAVNPFGKPHTVVFASQHDCALGWGGENPDRDELTVIASVGLVGCGAVCDYELLSPNDDLAPYYELNAVPQESQSLRCRLPLDVAAHVTEPARVIVRTSRGVRLVDFDKPPSGEETETGIEIAYIDDCLYADHHLTELWAYEEWWSLYGSFPDLWPLLGGPPRPPDPPPDPLSDPDPSVDLPGLYVKVFTIERWEPGELVQVRTSTCAIDVTTDQLGSAVIPVIVPRADRWQPISLTRVNRGETAGVKAQTAVFVRNAQLPGGTGNRIERDAGDDAKLTTDFADGSDVYQLARGKPPKRVTNRAPVVDAPPQRPAGLEIDLPGLNSVLQVPGFADEPVAIALLDDGGQLILNREPDGSTRVAGTVTGQLPRLDVAGDWALASGQGRLGIFLRSRA